MTEPAVTAVDSILIIDFGSQVTQLIARRLREAGVYCEIHPFNKAAEAFRAMRPKGVIFSGGPASVTIGTTVKIGADQTWTVADSGSTLTIVGPLLGEADITKLAMAR